MNYQSILDFIRRLYPGREIIPLHEPYLHGNEKKYLADCIDSTFVSSVGKYVDRFEGSIREFTESHFAVATVNGTAALHIALKLSGVRQGDLVITQPLTFIATCNAISYFGAEPVFVDIDKRTLGLSPVILEEWLSQNAVVKETDGFRLCYLKDTSNNSSNNSGEPFNSTRKISACVPMHTFGHPSEIDRIVEVCDRYHIPVVEDSAESIGSYYKGQHTGTFGKLGILSFNGNKTITTGGGGMILTDDAELGKLAKHITTTAKIAHPWKYEHDMIGYNYRLPNVNAALGYAQMEMLPLMLQNKRETASAYAEFFANYPDIEFIGEPGDCISNYWLNSILLPGSAEKEAFLNLTNESGIMTRPAWTLMNRLKMFEHCLHSDLSNAEEIEARLVNIPSSVRIRA